MISRSKRVSSKPTENAVEALVLSFMKARGWRATRNHVGLFKTAYGATVTIGTKGFPDWTFTRKSALGNHATIELMHVEAKRPGKRPTPKQFEVMASLNYMGELAVWCASLDHFKSIYFMYFPLEQA